MNPRSLAKTSLLLNVILAGAVVYLWNRPAPNPVVVEVPPGSSAQNSTRDNPPINEQPHPASGPVLGSSEATLWRQIESSDYAAYLANLRAIGCPEQTIHDIISADVNKLYSARRTAAYQAVRGPFNFWATDDHTQMDSAQSAELADRLGELERERKAVLGQLLGPQFAAEPLPPDQRTEQARRLAFLPEPKQNQILALEDSYPDVDEQIHALVDGRSPITDPQERQHLLEQYQRKKADLNQVLSPEELEQYEMSISWTADNLRRRMAGFEPSEEEFRTIFKLWRAQDEALASIYALHQPEPGNLDVFEAIHQFLGDARNAQYRQAWGGEPVPPAADGPSAASPAR